MKLEREQVLPLITAALKEDVGSRDLTSGALIGRTESAEAELVLRQEGVLAGLEVAEWAFGAANASIRFRPAARDGQRLYPNKVLAYLEGSARGILAGERVALNLLCHLSGIATLTRAFVEKVRGTGAKIFDTRKTTPNLRLLERYAVSAGGGVNHRISLASQILIKENHLRLVARSRPVPSTIEEAVRKARASSQKGAIVEVEVTNLQEFRQGLSARADVILLDNMRLTEIQESVRLRNALARSKRGVRVLLEVSGGITLETVRAVAECGVDRISVGALTHSAPALDISLEVIE